MPRRDRSFNSADVLRIIADNLSAIEQAEVIFELRFGPMRALIEKGVGFDEEDFRQLERMLRRLQRARGRV